MPDRFMLIQLLFQGQHGWMVLALAGLATVLLAKGFLRLFSSRPKKPAGSGSLKKKDKGADALLSAFERFYGQLARIKTDLETKRDTLPNVAERILLVSESMHRECQRLDGLQIAFPSDHEYRLFLARIERERGKAADLWKVASAAKWRIARQRRAAMPRQRAS